MEFLLIDILNGTVKLLYYRVRYPERSERLAAIRQDEDNLPLVLLVIAMLFLLAILTFLIIVMLKVLRFV